MNLAQITNTASAMTGVKPETIRLIVRRNWPNHERFTHTQCALLMWLIERKRARQ